MNLEDHAGDVTRKARAMKNVSPQAAADAAGLMENEFIEFETRGSCSRKIDYTRLGAALDLEGAKLQRIAGGWEPMGKDLSTWRELHCFTSSANDITVNCYLVWDEVS